MKPIGVYRRGFTIFEVILAMSIFILLAGAVYTAVSTTTTAAAAVTEEQIESRKLDAFIRFCRKGFSALPSEATVVPMVRDAGALGKIRELRMTKAPTAFASDLGGSGGSCLALAALPDGHGGASISLTRYSEQLTESELSQYLAKATWFPILDGVTALEWRFFDKVNRKFTTEWNSSQERPELIELEIAVNGSEPIITHFHVPVIVRQNSRPPPDSPPAPR